TAFVEPGSRTTLVIKTHSLEQFPALFQEMRDAAKSPNIALINEQWPRQKMSALYHTTDAYVSLHRAEGFGLPGAEAMAAGKPVIATGWSGNMDYMTLENSFPVDYRLVRHEYNSWWAEPDVAHAAQLMRHIYNNHETAQSHGNAAARTLQTGHSPQAIGRTMRSHLIRIVSRAPSARAEVRQQDELQRLSVDIRDAYAQWEYARMTETQVRAAGWPIVGFLIRTVFRVRSMGKQAASLSVLLAHVCNYTYRNWQLNREISAQLKDITARLNALEDQQQDA
ncbi:MAG: glycosyltransferase, partial [Chloroflexota bacterium]